MHIEPTISLGDIVALVALLASLVSIYIMIVRRLDRIEMKVKMMWRWYLKTFKLSDNGEHE